MSLKLKTDRYSVVFCTVFIACVLILIGHPFQSSVLVGIGTYVIAFDSILCLFWSFPQFDSEKKTLNYLFLLSTTTVAFVISYGFDYSLFVRLFTFLEVPTFILAWNGFELREKMVKNYLRLFVLLMPLLYMYIYQTPLAHRYASEAGTVSISALTLGYNNPNEAALYLFFFFVLALYIFQESNWIIRTILVIEYAIICRYIFETQCRTIIIFIIVLLAVVLIKKELKISRNIMRFVLYLPLLFAVLLVAFPEIRDIIIFGEAIDTGRHSLFSMIFANISLESFVFGGLLTPPLSNAHNVYLTLLGSLGFPASALFYSMIKRYYFSLTEILFRDFNNKICVMTLVLLMVYGATEAAFWVSGSVFAGMFFVIMALLNKNEN